MAKYKLQGEKLDGTIVDLPVAATYDEQGNIINEYYAVKTETNTAIENEATRAENKEQMLASNIYDIAEKIPTQATATNQLADKAFVNSSINNVAAYYITKNATGDAFATKAELTAATTFYSGGTTRTPTRNDYAIVIADESHKDSATGVSPTTRYSYNNGKWEFQYVVNNSPFTAAQWAAVNSGATDTLVGQITKNKNDISTLNTNLKNYLPLAGGTMTGAITLAGAPTSDLEPATKKYVDDLITTSTSDGYIKPSDGIPKTDLDSSVQASLDKADNAIDTANSAKSTADSAASTASSALSKANNAVLFTSQTLNDNQKSQARNNIGAGTSNFSGDYNSLSNKPYIPSIPSISVSISGSGNAVTSISADGHSVSVTKGTTFLTSHQSLPNITVSTVGDSNGRLVTNISASGHSITQTKANLQGNGISASYLTVSTDGGYSFSTQLGTGANCVDAYTTSVGCNSEAYWDYCTALGYSAIAHADSATAIGSGSYVQGNYSTAIGRNASTRSYLNATAIGCDANASASDQIMLGNTNITSLKCHTTSITSNSDSRIKEDIELIDTERCLRDILRLPVHRYKFKKFASPRAKDIHVSGFIAQEVEKVFPKSVFVGDEYYDEYDEDGNPIFEQETDKNGNLVYDKDNNPVMKNKKFIMKDVKSIDTNFAIPTLWGAVQYLAQKVEALEAKLAADR